MKKANKINIHNYVKNKIKRLRKDKLYDYSIFKDVPKENRSALIKAVSRMAKEEVIIKIGNGKFYKKGKRQFPQGKALNIKPRRKDWLKAGKVKVDLLKYRLSENLFWSNPNGKIPVENIIAIVLDRNSINDLDIMCFSFGDNKVKEVFLKYFDINKKPLIRDVLGV